MSNNPAMLEDGEVLESTACSDAELARYVAEPFKREVRNFCRSSKPAHRYALPQLVGLPGQHAGIGDQCGRDRVDGDAVVGEPRGQRGGQAVQACFGRRIVRPDCRRGTRMPGVSRARRTGRSR